MIEYRDMTFCPFWEDCMEGKTCMRALTQEIIKDAQRVGLPICQYLEKPDCWERISPKPKEEKEE